MTQFPKWANDLFNYDPPRLASQERVKIQLAAPLLIAPGEYRGTLVVMENRKDVAFRMEEPE